MTKQAVEAPRSHRRGQKARLKLGTLWEDNGFVFASETGKPLTRDYVARRSFDLFLKRTGLPEKRLHDLRHTCATLLLSQVAHPTLLQQHLGHASVTTMLNRYSRWVLSMDGQTARAMEAALRWYLLLPQGFGPEAEAL